jgi:hypothetical protein
MKKLIITLMGLIFVAMISLAADREVTLSESDQYYSFRCTTADIVEENDTVYFDVISKKAYPAMIDVSIEMDTVTATAGTPTVEVKLYGKCFEGDDYTYIGDSVVWTMAVADTPMRITTTTATKYRYYRLEFIADATNQLSYITAVEFKQWFTGGSLGVTSITDGTMSSTAGAVSGVTTLTLENGLVIDNAVNNKLEINENSDEFIMTFGSNTVTASSGDVTLFDFGTINLGTDALDMSEGDITNGGTAAFDQINADATALVIGAGTETVAINSSDWDIGVTGIVTGIGNVTSNGKILTTDTVQAAVIQATAGVNLGTSQALVGTTAMTIGAGTQTVAVNSSDWDIDATGIMTGIGNITSNGDVIATGGDFTGANGNFIDIGEAADGTITLGRDDAGTITLTSVDDDANAALTVSAGGTGALTVGDAGSTTAITSSDWAIGATGIATGLGDVTSDGIIKGGFQHLTPLSVFDGDTTLTAAHSGRFVISTHASGTTTVTIPDPGSTTVGVIYYILQTADQNLVVTAATANGNSIVCDGVATSDNVTISAENHKIGAGMIVIGISATQWYVGGLNPESVLIPEAAD